MDISVTILTKNCEKILHSTLEPLRPFKEVVILDTGSTDKTLDIAKTYPNVKIFSAPFTGFGPLHNLASSFATYPWILSIDSDEVPSPELIEELKKIKLDECAIYAVGRTNFFNEKKICFAGWWPDTVVRLYNRNKTAFSDAAVHERVLSNGLRTRCLKGTLHHTPYRQIDEFLAKMQKYSTLFAEERRGKEKSSFAKALLHGLAAFFKSYLLKLGILGGKEGLIISLYNSQTAYYKYLKLAELNKKI
jgi:glycosyltransferase involved in cell wall biosynthesis